MGDTQRTLRANGSSDALLREYLDALYEIRRKKPGAQLPLRDDDLLVLSGAVDLDLDAVEVRLIELMQVYACDEAAAVRRVLLQRRVLVPVTSFAIGATALLGAQSLQHASGAGGTATELVVLGKSRDGPPQRVRSIRRSWCDQAVDDAWSGWYDQSHSCCSCRCAGRVDASADEGQRSVDCRGR